MNIQTKERIGFLCKLFKMKGLLQLNIEQRMFDNAEKKSKLHLVVIIYLYLVLIN